LVAGDRRHRHPCTGGRQQQGAGVRGIELCAAFLWFARPVEQRTFFGWFRRTRYIGMHSFFWRLGSCKNCNHA
jgi:hypothetical protein